MFPGEQPATGGAGSRGFNRFATSPASQVDNLVWCIAFFPPIGDGETTSLSSFMIRFIQYLYIYLYIYLIMFILFIHVYTIHFRYNSWFFAPGWWTHTPGHAPATRTEVQKYPWSATPAGSLVTGIGNQQTCRNCWKHGGFWTSLLSRWQKLGKYG